MASQVQRRLDMNFPVRKSTHRSKSLVSTSRDTAVPDLILSPLKRNGRAVPSDHVPMSCSPCKKKKESSRVTRSRTRETPIKTSLFTKISKDGKKSENLDDACDGVNPILSSPAKTYLNAGSTPKKRITSRVKPLFTSTAKENSPTKHSLRSPSRENRVIPIFHSPVKDVVNSCFESPTKKAAREQILFSPSQFEKLTLTSPTFYRKSKDNHAQPNLSSPRKHVSFKEAGLSSPVRDLSSRLPLSPSKLFNQNLVSPVKAKKSPMRPTDSPSKRQLFIPVPSSILSTNLLQKDILSSPVKSLRKDNLASPVKSLRKDNLASPVKSRNVNTRSPSKVRRFGIVDSPSKSRRHTSPTKQQRTPVKKLQTVMKLQKLESPAYQIAKQSLHTAKPERLDCRDREVGVITEFLERHLQGKSGGSLYISGAPGTGKTASLLHIIDDLKAHHGCKMAYLNCMMLKDSVAVFRQLHEDLTGTKATGNRDTIKHLEKHIASAKKSIIVVLDEIDQLDSKYQEVLYTIFEWPSLPKSKLILVGIANALDLTDRILPRLQARPKCRPQLLNFAPYSKDQIASIIKGRLLKLEEEGLVVMEPSAIQFCARKVSAVAGDMRKALDVCRRAVEMVEHELRSQPVLAAGTSPRKARSSVPKRISVMHISRILSEVYGSSVKSGSQAETVPLQQKLVVCTLLVMLKGGRFKEFNVGKIHEAYCKVCTKRQVAKIDQSEFYSLCLLLETRGILGVKKGKETRQSKVCLKLDEKELEHALHDKLLVSSILQDGIPK